jgi:hypothetical protein
LLSAHARDGCVQAARRLGRESAGLWAARGGGRLGRASRRAGPQAGQPAQERGRERGGKGARLGRAQEKRPKKKEKRVFLFILFPILAIIHR